MNRVKLLLVDGNALVHRSFHALPPLTSPKGIQVNAVYGFFSILLGALEKLKPSHVITTFDVAGATFRDELYDQYKAKRPKAPQALYDQIPIIQEVLKKFDIPAIGVKGYEADDVIGTLSRKFEIRNSKFEIIILTGDKDVYQLIDGNTSVFIPKKGIKDASLIDEAGFLSRYGFMPKYLVDYKALLGDPSDNIPGVAGVGEKTAQKLIAEFKTLENIYRHLDTLDPSIQKKLTAHQDNGYLSKKLAQIDRRVPFEITLAQAKINDFDREIVGKAFLNLGFKSLIPRLPRSDRKIEKHFQGRLL